MLRIVNIAPRKSNKEIADKFDCELYRLIGRAHYEAGEDGSPAHRKAWLEVYWALVKARPLVREMMDKTRRAETF